MGKKKVFLGSDNHFCDSFLQRDLERLEKDYDCKEDKDMKEDRSRKAECSSFKLGVVVKDRPDLLFSF